MHLVYASSVRLFVLLLIVTQTCSTLYVYIFKCSKSITACDSLNINHKHSGYIVDTQWIHSGYIVDTRWYSKQNIILYV